MRPFGSCALCVFILVIRGSGGLPGSFYFLFALGDTPVLQPVFDLFRAVANGTTQLYGLREVGLLCQLPHGRPTDLKITADLLYRHQAIQRF